MLLLLLFLYEGIGCVLDLWRWLNHPFASFRWPFVGVTAAGFAGFEEVENGEKYDQSTW